MMPVDDRYFDLPWGTFELSSIAMSPDEPITIEAKQIKIGKYQPYEIKKVVVNPEKEATTVIFKDGTVEVVKKSPEDPEADIFSVVAYAVAERVYGSNSAFKREVVNKVEVMKSKEKKYDASIESLTKAVESLSKAWNLRSGKELRNESIPSSE